MPATTLRETSRGRLLIEILEGGDAIVGTNVTLARLGEDGWSQELGRWSSHDEDRSLADAIVEKAGLPWEEAESLAAQTFIFGGAALLVLALVAGLVWLLIEVL